MATDPLAPFRNLRSRPDDETFVVEGEIPVSRLLDSPHTVRAVVGTASHLERLAIPQGVEAHPLTESELREVVGFDFHRGCMACATRPAARNLEGLLETVRGRPMARIVVAENIADPANLGALARNCAAFGVDLLLVDRRGADPYGRRAIRASAATLLTLPMEIVDGTRAVQTLLRAVPGVRVLATDADPTATPVDHVPRTGPLALLMGNEGHGLSQPLLALAHGRVVIPMHGRTDSLNVAAATAVLLFALDPNRDRSPAGPATEPERA